MAIIFRGISAGGGASLTDAPKQDNEVAANDNLYSMLEIPRPEPTYCESQM